MGRRRRRRGYRTELAACGSAVTVRHSARIAPIHAGRRLKLGDEAWRAQVLGGAPRVGIEAAGGFGWERWLGPGGTFIGMTGFGASGRYEDLYTHFGITADAVVAAVMRGLG